MIRFMGRMVRAAGYLVLAAVVLVGIPWVSIRFVGWPLPTSVPDGATLRDWFDDPFAPTRFWKAVAVFGWLLWAAFVYFVVVEIRVRLGRGRLPRIRLAAPLQGLAAGVVGATATALATPAAHATVAPAAVATIPDLNAHPGTLASASSEPYYVVERGDWLSTVAARFLGDRDAYPRIQALNPHLEARDARFPNHIERGWRIVMPAEARDRGIRLHAAGHLHGPAAPAPTTAPSVEEESTRPDTPGQPEETADTFRGPVAAPPESDDLDGDGDGRPDVVVGPYTQGAMAGAGLLASLLFAMLMAERRRQRGLYPVGLLPPLPANGRAERELRIAQQPADVQRLDTALRSLGHGLADRTRLPDIVGVRLIGGEVQLLLGEPVDQPPAPWLDEGTQWTLPSYVEPAAAEAGPLLPMLATIGSRAGRHLLVDLERLGTLCVGGHPQRARDLLRHIACELACNTWSDDAVVILAGFGTEADTFTEIGPDRVHGAASAGEAISSVRAELAQRATTGVVSPPTVLVVVDPDAATRAALADLHQALVAAGRCGIAVVTTIPEDAPAIGTAALAVTDTGLLGVDLPGLRQRTDAATMPVDMLEPMRQVFRAAHLAPAAPLVSDDDLPPWDDDIDPTRAALAVFDPAAPDVSPADAPPAPAPTVTVPSAPVVRDQLDDDLATWHDETATTPRIGILGPIEVRMPGVLDDSRHRLYTELLLYLLTRPTRSADRASIEDALWYGHPAGETTIRKAIYKLRRWLGQRPDSQAWIPDRDIDGLYRLRDGILLDWHLLLRLRQRGHTRGDDGIADLQAALELVRGEPMRNLPDTGPYRRPYTWIGDSDIAPARLIATISDIAHRVAEHHLAAGDPATARWAIDQAWLADPDRGFDDLWYDRMRAEHHDGQTATLQHLVTAYLAARDAEVLEDLPPQTYNRIRALIPAA
jgi:hypothetical protein